MSRANVEAMRRSYDAFNRRDLAAFLAVMDAEVEAVSRLAAMEGGYHGHDGIRRWWGHLLDAFPDFAVEVVDVHDPGDLTLARLRLQARGADSATPLDETIWMLTRWHHGKILWWRTYETEVDAVEAVRLSEQAISQENMDLARRTLELANRGADGEVARYLAPDVEWHHNIGLGTPMEGIYRGREEVLALFRALRESFGQLRFELEEVRELSPSEVLALGDLHVRGRGSGASATTQFGAITEVRGGLAVRHRFWTDREAALEAAGARY